MKLLMSPLESGGTITALDLDDRTRFGPVHHGDRDRHCARQWQSVPRPPSWNSRGTSARASHDRGKANTDALNADQRTRPKMRRSPIVLPSVIASGKARQ